MLIAKGVEFEVQEAVMINFLPQASDVSVLTPHTHFINLLVINLILSRRPRLRHTR
jgi:hypothetical protein